MYVNSFQKISEVICISLSKGKKKKSSLTMAIGKSLNSYLALTLNFLSTLTQLFGF